MTRPPQRPRSAPPYRPPVARGQTYPPLGFGDDGRPRYQYSAPNPAAELPPEPPPPPAPAPAPQKPDPTRRVVAWVAAVLVAVVVIALGIQMFSSSGDDLAGSRRSDPPVSQSLNDPYLTENDQPDPTAAVPRRTPRTTPSVPGTRAPRSTTRSGPPQATTYEVNTETEATIFYMADTGIKIAVVPAGKWTLTTTTHGDARVNVAVTKLQAASCSITVEGKRAVTEQLDPSGPLRLLTCRE
ncbi:MAG: hypothetical protein WAW85_09225 [Gordonia sp. (in: high G+C Gram-positive bacteria)]|uniref:hypothetical protein n=1 Tax=Gordonia sp. (in: high G+C Gram-positive bacteria) TaxID=84139 RepID=UPI003BB4903C